MPEAPRNCDWFKARPPTGIDHLPALCKSLPQNGLLHTQISLAFEQAVNFEELWLALLGLGEPAHQQDPVKTGPREVDTLEGTILKQAALDLWTRASCRFGLSDQPRNLPIRSDPFQSLLEPALRDLPDQEQVHPGQESEGIIRIAFPGERFAFHRIGGHRNRGRPRKLNHN